MFLVNTASHETSVYPTDDRLEGARVAVIAPNGPYKMQRTLPSSSLQGSLLDFQSEMGPLGGPRPLLMILVTLLILLVAFHPCPRGFEGWGPVIS